MKIKTLDDANLLFDAANQCEGAVTLVSDKGDEYNLRSAMTQMAVTPMLLGGDEEFELFAMLREDKERFLRLFFDHPQLINM